MARHGRPEEGDPFAIADLWEPSLFTVGTLNEDAQPWCGLDVKLKSQGPVESGILVHADPLALPSLETFSYGALEHIPELGSVSSVSGLEPLDHEDATNEEDLWIDAGSLSKDHGAPSTTWEAFFDPSFSEPARYLSDLGPAAFDAVLTREYMRTVEDHSKRTIFKQQPALMALKLLGLGFSSWLFADLSENDFRCRYEPMTLAGLSQPLTESLFRFFGRSGSAFKQLRSFVRSCYSEKSSSITMAYATAIARALDATALLITDHSNGVETLIQLQAAYEQPSRCLALLVEMAALVQNAPSGPTLLTKVHDFACHMELNAQWARPLLLAILDSSTAPWLRALNYCLGVGPRAGCDEKLIHQIESQAQTRIKDTDFGSEGSVMPSFISASLQELMLETCSSLILLREHSCDWPPKASHWWNTSAERKLRWDFSSKEPDDDISTSEESVASPCACAVDPYGQSSAAIDREFRMAASAFESLPTSWPTDDIAAAVQVSIKPATEQTGAFLCPLSLAAHLSFAPVVETQHRILGQECLRMFFNSHSLQEHFELQRRFHCFADGVFASRLAQALFSNDLSRADGRHDYSHVGEHGLRLGDRTTWPPGGSELRLVLMGILNETYYGSYSSMGAKARDLPGQLSFGIRNLTEPEIDAVMDPYSLPALDFLRLQYNPPVPLDTIFTDRVMEKYDQVFKLLLRTSRVLAATAQMAPRRRELGREDATTARFRIAASRFMEALSGYFLDGAIELPWARFARRLDALRRSLDASDSSAESNASGIASVFELRAAHDRMLDTALFGLLLRRRQAPALALLDEILALILRFARIRAAHIHSTAAPATPALYDTFRTKVRTFIAVCRGLGSRTAYAAGSGADGGGRRRDDDNGGLEQLVLRLDMNGWWTKH